MCFGNGTSIKYENASVILKICMLKKLEQIIFQNVVFLTVFGHVLANNQ